MSALDQHRMVVIERDNGRGRVPPFHRRPDLVWLPPIHAGDVQLGNPCRVVCESIEAIHMIDALRLLLRCDNNFPTPGATRTGPTTTS